MIRLFHLDVIKAIAIDTDHSTLRNKRIGVNIIDDAEDRGGLPALRQDKHHGLLMPCVETFGIDQRHTAVKGIDLFRNLLILLGNDEELHRLPTAVHHLIEHKTTNEECHEAIEHLLPILQHQIAGGDNDQITEHDDTPQGDVTILIDYGRDNIRASRTAIAGERDANANATQGSP